MLSAGCVFVAYYGLAVVKFGSIETLTDSSPMMSRSTPTIIPQTSPNKRTAERTTRAGGLRGRSARWGEMMIVNSWARAAW